MKRYQINENELLYLKEMIEFLSNKDNNISEQGSLQLREVFDRITSRPVVEVSIDPTVFDEFEKEIKHV